MDLKGGDCVGIRCAHVVLGVPHEQGFMWGVPAWTTHGLSHVCMYVCMYVCVGGWMDGWMDGWYPRMESAQNNHVEQGFAISR